jgi:hypothetical protein
VRMTQITLYSVQEEVTAQLGQMSQSGAILESTTHTMENTPLTLACLVREVTSVTRLVLEVCITTTFIGAHQDISVSREHTLHSHARLELML